MRMKNKVALISGASSGMGAATARLLAREGAKAVVVADLLDKEGEAVVAERQHQAAAQRQQRRGSAERAIDCRAGDCRSIDLLAEAHRRIDGERGVELGGSERGGQTIVVANGADDQALRPLQHEDRPARARPARQRAL